ncbi:MAG: helix-turn-helix domain-containing protein [Bacillota bacterium]
MKSIEQIAQRIKGMREILNISVEEMAKVLNMSKADYLEHESGKKDFTFSFLFACANKFNMDVAELLTGENAHLKSYAIERKGKGLSVERRKGFDYLHLASRFRNRKIEPYIVSVPYTKEENKPIKTSSHEGQEMDYVLEGSLNMYIDKKAETLNEGDCIYYDSSLPHGMTAANNKGCKFLAILIK